jgi:hypothetical protein
MFNIGSLNIRGLNGHLKQKTIHDWTLKNNLNTIGLLETKLEVVDRAVAESNLDIPFWKYLSNINASSHCCILVG